MSEHRKGVHAARCFLVPCYNMLSFPNILITVANSLYGVVLLPVVLRTSDLRGFKEIVF